MKRISFLLSLAVAMLLASVAVSCSVDESFTTDRSALLSFSQDTVSFDTVFTSVGSSTQNIRVFNNQNEGIRISNIRLASGGTSGFRVNVDGMMGTDFSDVEIHSNDSMYVFVESLDVIVTFEVPRTSPVNVIFCPATVIPASEPSGFALRPPLRPVTVKSVVASVALL